MKNEHLFLVVALFIAGIIGICKSIATKNSINEKFQKLQDDFDNLAHSNTQLSQRNIYLENTVNLLKSGGSGFNMGGNTNF